MSEFYQRARQLRRTWQVIAILRSGGGATLDKLATVTGVTTRTIRRDLAAIQAAGLAIYDIEVDDGTRLWRFVKGAPCALCGRGLATGKEYREVGA